MGYDMHLVDTTMTETEQAELAAANAEVDATVKERNALTRGTPEYEQAQGHVERAFKRKYAADVTYFRLNIWGMSACRELMAELGMLKPDVAEPTPWPEVPDGDYDAYYEWDEAQESGEGAVVTEQTERFAAFRRQQQQRLSEHVHDQPGIAVNKLGSNDGWIVTPGEAMTVPGLWQKVPAERQLEILADHPWFASWVKFCARAVERGGFRVY